MLHDTGYFMRGELERLVDDHEQGRQDHSAILWLVLVFQTFLEHLAGKEATSPADGSIVCSKEQHLMPLCHT